MVLVDIIYRVMAVLALIHCPAAFMKAFSKQFERKMKALNSEKRS